MTRKKPVVLMCTPEVIYDISNGDGETEILEFRTGGLATVNSTYIRELANDSDLELHVAVPKWKSGLRELLEMTDREEEKLSQALHRKNFHLIEDASFNKAVISGGNIRMYDNTARFTRTDRTIAFNRAIINWVFPFVSPDVVWLSDWMLGLTAAASKQERKKTLYTIHGITTDYLDFNHGLKSGIDLREFRDSLYFAYKTRNKAGQIDLLSTGIFSSDFMSTVSPTFLQEIVQGKHAHLMAPEVLDMILSKYYSGRAKGILNPEETENSVFLDEIERYGIENVIRNRKNNTRELRQKTGLVNNGRPIFVYPNRLFDFQKKASLFLDNAQELSRRLNIQFLIIANGDPELEKKAGKIAISSNGAIAYYPFNSPLEEFALRSDNVYGLMTSDYEPCGRPNIVYPGEGVLVVAHKVGGIADSTSPIDVEQSRRNGFPYEHNDFQGLEYGLRKAVEFSSLPEEKRYSELIRISRENLAEHSPKARAREIKGILLQLYEEKMRE